MNRLLQLLLGGRSAFDRTFRLNEYRAVSGRGGGKTLLWLSLIVGVTLASLGFGVGSLEQLAIRMDNPFTNIVDMSINSGYRQEFERKRKDILAAGKPLGLDTITQWTTFRLNLLPRNAPLKVEESLYAPVLGRTMDYDSKLFNFVFNSDNVIYGADFRGEDYNAANFFPKGGIIVRDSLLRNLGYHPREYEELRAFPVYHNALEGVYYVPVLAIVKDLPSNAAFVSSLEFNASIYGPGCNLQVFKRNKPAGNIHRFVVPADHEEEFIGYLREVVAKKAGLEIDTDELPGQRHRLLRKVEAIVDWEYLEKDSTYYADLLQNLASFQDKTNWVEYVEYEYEKCPNVPVHRASFLFSRLDDIKKFKKKLMEMTELEISTEVAENKDNFAKVSTLGNFMGLILLLFSVASICFFIRNLIESHLNEIKPNLGTFKAFGLPDRALITHYRRILVVLLAVAVVAGFLVAPLVGFPLQYFLKGHYDMFNWEVAGAVGLIFLFSILFSGYIIRKILARSPGDLVYGRS